MLVTVRSVGLKLSTKANLLAVSHVLLALGALSSPAVTVSPIVNLGYAQYQGSVDMVTNITSFLGIRYAAPPVGDLRWAAPQPPLAVSGVQQATTQPNRCNKAPTGNSLTNPFESTSMRKRAISQSEDCLFLNVYTPGSKVVATPGGGLPVVVFIHGGGYITGAASVFNGADLIVDSNHGVITVLIQYRLGLFGFLPGKAVKEGGALNAGLQLCITMGAGLPSVATPAKVTIWGESAGAGSVLQHIVAHGGNTQPPLFETAMTSSTFLPSQYNYNDRIPEMLYSEVVNGTNCTSSSDTLSCLRAADVNTLQTLNYNINVNGFFGTFVFVPVVDGTFILERPTVTIRKGRLNGKYLLSMTNSHEGNAFVDQSMTLDVADYVKTLFPNFGSAQVAGAVTMYENYGSNLNQANLQYSFAPLIISFWHLGERAWKGEFAIPPGLHGSDVAYYFTSYGGGPPYNNSQFITAFSNSFMAMAMFETPDDRYTPGDITPSWTSWQYDLTEMKFNETFAGVPDIYTFKTDSALLERCA
ncbi:Alpha/Beta hydrolase protein [Suillus subalutaceus]|uniref:Alpha/Beta hydrolase protein n=1 Tax=Suillus subalutaceus TaxID=48586 RepID=UPI001B85D0B9|nr:Alpha/Beta hydrolase protein [Suillus subalutaceus]KAG1834979.1 Alpha/Beta hydrolase protein [Suillus subalutaceus]